MRLQPIEYIGPAPKVKKQLHPAGGWLLLLFAVALGFFLARPMLPFLQAQQSQPNATNLERAISDLNQQGGFSSRLAAAALQRTKNPINYSVEYWNIDFPGGDIPADKGKAEDVIIRAYRSLGVDLQLLVNDDMKANFTRYPYHLWGLERPDPNIDHRRAANLQRFFGRNGETLPISNLASDYNFGDLVFWNLPEGTTHVGIVVPGPGELSEDKWIVHNNGSGPRWEDELFAYQVLGHFRYAPAEVVAEVTES
ncbi:MAG: DUF1287 domain-containing protein [Verrucomicrobiota bacterium JB023]|nr:DUF1287 domain-containing protein [Verrucomicrobiota bacterium JB023]